MIVLRTMTMIAAIAMPLAAAQAQTVTLKPGEAVTLVAGDDDAPHEGGRAAIIVSDYEAAVALEFQRGDYDAAVGDNSAVMKDGAAAALAEPVAPGRIVLRFVRPPGKAHALLTVANGLGRAFVYRARMTVDGKTTATDVCLVPPGKGANEYWPNAIERLELSDLRLVRWQEGDRISCE